MPEKQLAAEKAAEFIDEGMIIGLGTGSTVNFFLKKLGEMVNGGFNIKGVSTSNNTTALALSYKISLIPFNEVEKIDLTIDGADEVDTNFNGIKGGGGALLFEKIIASASSSVIWIVDSSKLVKNLGKFLLPVEIIPFGYKHTLKKLAEAGLNPKLRILNNEIYFTDSNNFIVDLNLEKINNPEELESQLNSIPGVIENGLFINMADKVIIGKSRDVEIRTNKNRNPG